MLQYNTFRESQHVTIHSEKMNMLQILMCATTPLKCSVLFRANHSAFQDRDIPIKNIKTNQIPPLETYGPCESLETC